MVSIGPSRTGTFGAADPRPTQSKPGGNRFVLEIRFKLTKKLRSV
jgi:hypothetical protein